MLTAIQMVRQTAAKSASLGSSEILLPMVLHQSSQGVSFLDILSLVPTFNFMLPTNTTTLWTFSEPFYLPVNLYNGSTIQVNLAFDTRLYLPIFLVCHVTTIIHKNIFRKVRHPFVYDLPKLYILRYVCHRLLDLRALKCM